MDESPSNPFASVEMEDPILAPSPRPYSNAPLTAFFIIIFCYLLMNFFFVIVGTQHFGRIAEYFSALWGGAMVGQVCFLTIWAVLGPFRLWVRWAAVLASCFAIYFSFFLGMIVAYGVPPHSDLSEAVAPSFFIPLVFLLAQFPLWIRKAISGWRIVPVWEAAEHSATEARQFGIAHILGLMVFLAVSLSLIQMAMSLLMSDMPGDFPRSEMLLSILAALGLYGFILCVFNAMWMGPCLRACFLAQSKALGLVAISVLVLIITVLLALVLAIIMSFSGGPSFSGEAAFAILLCCSGLAATLMASLHLVRFTGYTMIRRTRAGREPGPDLAMSGHPVEGDCPFAST